MNEVSGAANNVAPRQFDEQVFRRHTLAEWDGRWHRLSRVARFEFLHVLKIPASMSARGSAMPDFPIAMLSLDIRQELTSSGFLELQPGKPGGLRARVVANEGLYDFARRVHALRQYHLLVEERPSELAAYVHYTYFVDQLIVVLSSVLRAAGIAGPSRLDELLYGYVIDHEWPARVAGSLDEPLADRILDVVMKADQPIPSAELPDRIAGSDPNEVRAVMDRLVARLALVEDVRPLTWELVVGFLPAVREKIILASMLRERPPLLEPESLREIGPDGSPVESDIRTVLLEVAIQPPRLRQDHKLFHKEIARFHTALDPLAGWLLCAMKWSADGRPDRAIGWALALQLAKVESEGNQIRLHLTPKGQTWLSGGASEVLLEVYRLLRKIEAHGELYSPNLGLLEPRPSHWGVWAPGDAVFLGAQVVAVKVEEARRRRTYWDAKTPEYLALRAQLDLALSVLKARVFYRLDSIESHLVFVEHNPLNLGLPAEQVAVFWRTRSVPAARPQREEIGRQLINAFVLERLVPFGCVRAAIDDDGRIYIAREPLFGAFFGREITRSELTAASSDVAARVVVQPDFSVVIIGPNPAPAAALAPFCERTTRGGGQGAIVLKLTRESVVKAVKNGLKPAEVVARLERHASNEVPANVLRQVNEWSNWVRKVTCSSWIALHCPDSETADRVIAVMKRQAERVNSTVVAVDRKKLTTTERNKLEDHGILVEDEPAD